MQMKRVCISHALRKTLSEEYLRNFEIFVKNQIIAIHRCFFPCVKKLKKVLQFIFIFKKTLKIYKKIVRYIAKKHFAIT